MPEVVQGRKLSQPWQELLDLVTPIKNPRTRTEMMAGKMRLLQQQSENEHLDWKEFGNEVVGMASTATADAMFRLEEFMKLNEALTNEMARWNIKNVRAAVVHECTAGTDICRVKAITSQGTVMFEEPLEGFPAEDLMTKLQMINPVE